MRRINGSLETTCRDVKGCDRLESGGSGKGFYFWALDASLCLAKPDRPQFGGASLACVEHSSNVF